MEFKPEVNASLYRNVHYGETFTLDWATEENALHQSRVNHREYRESLPEEKRGDPIPDEIAKLPENQFHIRFSEEYTYKYRALKMAWLIAQPWCGVCEVATIAQLSDRLYLCAELRVPFKRLFERSEIRCTHGWITDAKHFCPFLNGDANSRRSLRSFGFLWILWCYPCRNPNAGIGILRNGGHLLRLLLATM
jgi:hypothetical protein